MVSDVLAGAAATFSKSPRFWSGDPDWQPKAIVRGRGARVLGDDGRGFRGKLGRRRRVLGYHSCVTNCRRCAQQQAACGRDRLHICAFH